MDATTLNDLMSLREDIDMEFKAAQGRNGKGKVPKSFWDTYSAMANTDGGVILFGVKEKKKGEIIVLGVEDTERVKKELWDNLNNPQKASVNLLNNNDVKIFEIQGRKILQITVPRAERKKRPVYVGANPLRGTYRRNYEGDYLCDEETIRRMLAESLDESRDIALLDGFDMGDLEPSTLAAYRNLFSSTRLGHPWLDYNDKDLLRSLGGWTKDRETGREGLTLAGLLMFGRLRSILDATANYLVDYQERSGDGDQRWIDRITTDGSWSGNLFDFYRLVYRKLIAELKVPFRLKEKGRRIDETHVHEALREAIVNALIHADYSGSIGILIVKFPNAFYFRNPGGLRLPLATVLEGGTSDCRNRNLQKMFQLSGAGEQAGSGMPKILRAWKKQHWRTPLLREEQDMKQTVLRLSMVSLLPQETMDELGGLFGKKFGTLNEIERLALATAHMEGTLTNQRLKEISSEHPRDLTFVLGSLVERGFLEKSGVGRGTVYSLPGGIRGHMLLPLLSVSATMQAVHDPKSAEAIERTSYKAPSLQHKGLDPQQLSSLQEAARQVRSKKRVPCGVMESMILMLCKDRFLSRRELAELIGRSPASLQNHYLSRMVKKRLLVLKYPDNPRHPGQKYRAKGSSPQHKEIILPT